MDLHYEVASAEDIPEITKVMTRAFDHDAQLHLNKEKGGPSGYDNGEFFQRWMVEEKKSIGYKIINGDKIIGAFLIFVGVKGSNFEGNSLGTIFIDPDYQNKGIGYQTWQYIEKTLYPDAKAWVLDTPSWATRNHHFYAKKCGFTKVAEAPFPEGDDAPGSLFIFEKRY